MHKEYQSLSPKKDSLSLQIKHNNKNFKNHTKFIYILFKWLIQWPWEIIILFLLKSF